GGTISARGTFDYGLLSATEAQTGGASLTIAGRGLGLDFPAGLQSEVDTDLTLRVEGNRPQLSGRVTILRGEYRRPLSLLTQLLGTARLRSTQPSDTSRLADRVGLDVRVVTDADLQVDNNYGRFDLGGDLRAAGSIGGPRLVGRVEMREGGQIFLGGIVYLIDRGSIDFSNQAEIEPDLDISARTHVAGHEITLTISGTPDRLTTNLTADDSSLAKADIISLLLTGRPYSEVTSQQASESGQQLLGLLSGEVLGVAGRAVGLDTLRFERGIGGDLGDLGDIASETDPAARLTLAKNLSPEVRLLLSHNLKQSGGLTWIVSYQPRPNLELRAVARDNRDRAYEVRHQVSFGGPAGAAAPRSAAPQPRVQAVKIMGHAGVPSSDLARRLHLVEGRRFDFRTWRDDRDRLARLYSDAGYLEARIIARRVGSAADAIVLEYEVERGPRTQLDVRGASLSQRASDAIRSAWLHAVFDRFLEDEAARLARIDLVRAGFLEAQVRASMDRAGSDEKRLVVSINPGPRRAHRGFSFRGNKVFSSRDLEARADADDVELAAWLNPAAFGRWLMDLYHASGLLAARVQIGAVQFPTPTSAKLPVTIEEGPRYQVGQIRLEGVAASRQDEVRQALGLKAGDRYTPIELEEARQRVERLYRRLGFNDVSVRPSAATDSSSARVDLALAVREGAEQRLERTDIEGLEHTRRDVVERALDLTPGGPVDVSEWQRGRRRLSDTGVFRRVDIEPVAASLPSSAPAGPQPVVARVTLEERPPWRLRYGLQLDDEAKPAGEGRGLSPGFVTELLDRNLFGRAATAGSTLRFDRHQRLARGFVSTPRLFGLAATTSLFVTRSREERGTLIPIFVDKSSVSGEQRVRPFAHLDVTYGYSLEQNHTFNPAVDPNDPLGIDFTVRIARLTGIAVVDTRDDPFETTRGSFHSSSLEYAPGALGSDLRFVKFLAQQTYFRSTRRVVLASSARLGMGRGFGQDLILSEQFLAGGGNSVRGYEEDAIGGRDVLDQPVGGNAMIVLNQEIRFPLYKWIGGVGFVDAGNVFGSASALSVFDLKVGTGVGLRVATPFALLRVDFGVPVSTPVRGARRGRWYFSIGQMF
ncbi:MAG: translocation/assembly module TamB domain-containing protein, partial [Acidobacteria bacterium]|nr:translocation/assembly module TamB domain-containing protein [Acidobacteriota bacterium]